jgi:peptidyl-tRNA hydrolase
MTMKNTIMIILCILTTAAYADTMPAGGSGGNPQQMQQMREEVFNQFKQIRIDGIQTRIGIDQTALSCVQNAQKREDMKACETAAKTAMQNLKQTQQQKMQALKQTLQQEHQHNQQQVGSNGQR